MLGCSSPSSLPSSRTSLRSNRKRLYSSNLSRDWEPSTSGHLEKVIWPVTPGEGEVQQQRFTNLIRVRKDDSDWFFCSAANLLGKLEKKTFLVVVTSPRFTVKPPAKVSVRLGGTLTLNCSASGVPRPVVSWKKQEGQLPFGRSQQINGELVIRGFQPSDAGNYICVATSAGVVDVETYTEVHRGGLILGVMFF